MLMIKNVTRDDDKAVFTCHWTSYTATISFAVTDKPVTTPSMPEENTTNSSVVLVVVVMSVILLVIVIVVVSLVFFRHLVKGIIDRHGTSEVNADSVCTRVREKNPFIPKRTKSIDGRDVIDEENDLEKSV